MNRIQKQKADAAKKKRTAAGESERVIAYRLRDRDLTQLISIERSARWALNGVTEIINRMRQGEHPTTDEEAEDDRSGFWSIESFLKDWQINQGKFFENRAILKR